MNETNQTDRFAPLFTELDRRLAGEAPVRLAIEGGSASGKTTLGKILAERYDCTVLHMDDFFLRPEQRTAYEVSVMHLIPGDPAWEEDGPSDGASPT